MTVAQNWRVFNSTIIFNSLLDGRLIVHYKSMVTCKFTFVCIVYSHYLFASKTSTTGFCEISCWLSTKAYKNQSRIVHLTSYAVTTSITLISFTSYSTQVRSGNLAVYMSIWSPNEDRSPQCLLAELLCSQAGCPT